MFSLIRNHSENITGVWTLLGGHPDFGIYPKGECSDFANLPREGVPRFSQILTNKKKQIAQIRLYNIYRGVLSYDSANPQGQEHPDFACENQNASTPQ